MVSVARGKVDADFARDQDLAAAIGMSPQSFSAYKRQRFQNLNFSLFCKMARILKFSARDLCAMVGVPYDDEKGGENRG